MIVLKIGGTSMANADRMDRALDIAAGQLSRAPLMVCSAMGGVTDCIIDIAEAAESGQTGNVSAMLQSLKSRHADCAAQGLSGAVLEETLDRMESLFDQFAALLKGISLLRDCSPRSLDALLSFGERLSTRLIFARAIERGLDTYLLDAQKLIRTDNTFSEARVDMRRSFELIAEHVHPREGGLIVTQGFIGSGDDGATTTLGRGGSDYSASLLGAALHAEEIQIWTDVPGIMTCDPRIIPQASTVARLSYDEAAELAFFGAKVVHPATIQPAVAHLIPVLVKDSGNPDAGGTYISEQSHHGGTPGGEPSDGNGLKALSVKTGITVINVSSSRMLETHGFLARLFEVFDNFETSVDLVTTSEVSVSVTIDRNVRLDAITAGLKKLGQVTVEENQAIICMVGRNLWKDPVFHSRVFKALENMPIRMISLGSSDVNLSLVVPDEYSKDALRSLHSLLLE